MALGQLSGLVAGGEPELVFHGSEDHLIKSGCLRHLDSFLSEGREKTLLDMFFQPK